MDIVLALLDGIWRFVQERAQPVYLVASEARRKFCSFLHFILIAYLRQPRHLLPHLAPGVSGILLFVQQELHQHRV